MTEKKMANDVVTRLIPKATMLSILWEDIVNDGEVLRNEMVGQTRWEIQHELIFRWEGKIYKSHYSVGATECQDTQAWEFDGDSILCYEVREVRKVVIDYEIVRKDAPVTNLRETASEAPCG